MTNGFQQRNFLADIGQGVQNALAQQAFTRRAQEMAPGSYENRLREMKLQGLEQQQAQQQQSFSLDQQRANTQWIIDATDRVMKNPADLGFYLQQGQQRGIIDPGVTPDAVSMDMVSDMNRQARMVMPEYAGAARKEEITKGVQSSEFLPGGGARVVMKDGTTRVVKPSKDELAFIRAAEERGVDIQQQRAKGRELGSGSAKIAHAAIDQVEMLSSNNSRLSRVVEEVKAGASTGPLVDKLPSFRASTRRLIQLKNELGLDVVGAVTFGALSEGELSLALDTALPTGLEGPELIRWAEEKIAAQEKLSDYLVEQAIFLGKRGNTAVDWIEKTRATTRATEEAPQTVDQPQSQGGMITLPNGVQVRRVQ